MADFVLMLFTSETLQTIINVVLLHFPIHLIDIEHSFNVHVRLESFLDPPRKGTQPLDEAAFVLVASDNHF